VEALQNQLVRSTFCWSHEARTKPEDKVANNEGWRHRNPDPRALASRAIDRRAALEGKIKLEVTVERTAWWEL
jgi:hypothetical protein